MGELVMAKTVKFKFDGDGAEDWPKRTKDIMLVKVPKPKRLVPTPRKPRKTER